MTYIKVNSNFFEIDSLAKMSNLSVDEVEQLANKGSLLANKDRLTPQDRVQVKRILDVVNGVV